MTDAALNPQDIFNDPLFERLKAHVIDATGLSYFGSQDMELARHLSERLTVLHLSTCGAYWVLLHDGKNGEAELDLLIAQLTIGETFFFRHEEQFHAIRDRVLPDLIERNRSTRRLRIWSAGCATGAEPYSIAIVLKQCWPDVVAEWDVTIVGTDINRAFLAQARQGRYGEWALRATPADIAESCFVRSGNEWMIRPEYRRGVVFDYHNLVHHPYHSFHHRLDSWDLILCRNVMIYFNHETNRRIIRQFHGCVADNGWLVVGHAESNTELFQDFETINTIDAVIYRKTVPATPATHVARHDGCRSQPLIVLDDELSGGVSFDDERKGTDEVHQHLSCAPLNPEEHLRQALMWQQRGRPSDAEKALRRAIYLDRGFVLAHYYLGLLLKRRSELPGAKRCFRNALRLLEPIDRRAVMPTVEGIDASVLTELTRMHFEEVKYL
ncbi:MAG TPA: protein-glutamate O-methyltransferase CheR [Pirellulales bacterium]|jgi:chemotaxis protein methyltransferase CheR|nr:protein-glutamate O-methyltransferase CheR [Pirellulales bacterium]